MPNPSAPGNNAEYEWVEIVNIWTKAVDTNGWKLSDSHISDEVPSAIIPAGDYLLVAAASAVLPEDSLIVCLADGKIGNGLNNLGETITLTAPDGSVADSMSFEDGDSPEAD